MIVDTLNHAERYYGLHRRLALAFEFLRAHDLNALPVGRIDIDEDWVFALVQEYDSKEYALTTWEAHRRYTDIQYLVKGQERMDYAALESMQIGEFNAEQDYLSLEGHGQSLVVKAGTFTVFFPEDAHRPGMCIDKPQKVRKIVLKVSLGD